MNILICSQFYLPKLGGVETSIYHLSKSLIKNGYNVDLLTETRFQEEIPNYSSLEMNFINYEKAKNMRNPFYYIKRYYILIHKIRRIDLSKYDFIISRDPIATVVLNKLKIKHVFIPGSIEIEFFDGFKSFKNIITNIKLIFRLIRMRLLYNFEKKALKHTSYLLLFSENFHEILSSRNLLKPSTNVFICRPGISEKFHKIPNLKTNIEKEQLTFLYLGRLVTIKNVELIIDAFIKANIEKSQLLIVGSGDQFNFLKSKAQKYKNIIFLGQQSDTNYWYNIADYTVSASKFEPFGHIIHESMKAGTPVIGFRKSSNSKVAFEEIISKSNTGLIVEEYTAKALSMKMIEAARIKNDEKEYLELVKNCETYSKNQSWDKFTHNLVEYYTKKF
jgi:glycosyltransferase involved in cell wall biosynthesis